MHVKLVTLCCRCRPVFAIALSFPDTTIKGWPMNKHTACALYLSFLTLPALAQTGTPPAEPPALEAVTTQDVAPATVVVEGRRLGPGVWKVSKDGHVLWVFGV